MTRSASSNTGRRAVPETIVDCLRMRASEPASHPAYMFLTDTGDTEQVSYAELDARARAIGGWLRTQAPAGSRMLLLYPPGLDYIAAFFGCLYGGMIAVPAYPPRQGRTKRGQARLDTVIADADVALVLTCAAAHPKVDAFVRDAAPGRLICHATTAVSPDCALDWTPPALARDTIAFLQYTSGSTSHSKGVMVSHGNIMANERMIEAACGHTHASTFVGWLPMYHDMGLLGTVLQPLYIGAACILMSPTAFLQKPARWLHAISRYRGHTSGAPNFAYGLCTRKITDDDCAGLDLSSWTIAFNGAEPLHAETMDEFSTRFAPYGFRRESFYPCYGLAEATLIVSGGPRTAPPIVRRYRPRPLEQGRVEPAHPADTDVRSIVSSGLPVRDTTIAIVNPETRQRCARGEVGEIWVSGPAVARGYWNRPRETKERLRACLPGGRRPFLRTGDLGFIEEDAGLFVTGRLRDLIIVRGRNHHPEDLEWTVLRCDPALRAESAAAFAITRAHEEQVVVAIEVHRRDDPRIDSLAAAVRGAIAEDHELQVYDVVLVEAGTLPKTSSGKIQRYLCRQAYLANELAVIDRAPLIAAETDEEAMDLPVTRITKQTLLSTDPSRRTALIVDYLQAVIGMRLGTGRLSPDVPLVTAGLDSLMAVEAAHRVQVDLEVPVDMASLLNGSTIADLAAWLSARLHIETAPADEATGTDDEDTYPLSQGQKALWFIHRADPGSAAYNISRAIRISGPVDVDRLRQAVARIGDRHPQLRVTFVHDGTDWMQHPDRAASPSFQEVEATAWTDAELDRQLQQAADAPFDLTHGPVLRVTLYRRSAGTHVLLFSLHHSVADLWSVGIILRDLGTYYSAAASNSGPTGPAGSYAGFVRWQTRMLAGDAGERLWSFWKETLAGELAALDFLTDTPRTPQPTTRGARHRFELDAELTGALRRLAQRHGATLHTVLMAALQLLLQRYTGRTDFVIGTPVVGRSRAAFADVVGHFVNVLPVRARLRHDLTFAAFLERTHDTSVRALAHQDYPFSLLVERLQPARDPNRPPLCQVLFALQRTSTAHRQLLSALALQHGEPSSIGSLHMQPHELNEPAVPFELILTMAETGNGVGAMWEFHPDRVEPWMIERMTRQLLMLLTHATHQPDTRLTDCPTVTDSERAQILGQIMGAGNAMPRDWRVDLPIQRFERQARLTPDAIAVSCADVHVSARALDGAAARLAARLRARGIGPESIVGLACARSPRLLVGLLAIMKAGAAFLPVDLDYPPQRIAFMLRDARVGLLLTDRAMPPLDGGAMDTLTLDDFEHEADDIASPAPSDWSPHQLAYVNYTSGSTGVPKGVQVTLGGLANLLAWMPERIGLTRDDVMLAVTSLSFDIAVAELLAPLMVGARVCLGDKADAAHPAAFADQLTRTRATITQATATSWRLLTDSGWPGNDRLTIVSTGEALPPDLSVRLRRAGAAAYNLYGPTETTVYSAVHQLTSEGRLNAIGGPIANTRLLVLDAEQNLAPVGVIGELCIGGAGLARGYLGRPDLSADRFVPDRFGGGPGARLYRTGDCAYVGEDGVISFMGRRDGQIKRHGVRIELGEIEAALRAQPGVTDAVVVFREDDRHRGYLAAYVIAPRADETLTASLYAGLSTRLPSSMLPSSITCLDAFPRTLSGKLDRQALPAPDREPAGRARRPGTPLEAVLAVEWARVLECRDVGVDDNFFALGGHSLLATHLVWQLQDAFPTTTPLLALLLRHPTVARLADAIERHARPGVDLAARVRALRQVQMMSDDEVDSAVREMELS